MPGLAAWVGDGLPKEIADYQQRMAAVSAEKRPLYERAIARDQWWLAQLRTVHIVPADLLVADSITLVRGQRTIVTRYLGRANTRGDLVVYLPRERVLATGDLVVNPMPYATESYLGDWVHALDALHALEPLVIVPGHGAIEHDFRYVDLVRRLLVSTLGQVRDAVAKGLDLEATRKAVDIDSLRVQFTGGDARRTPVFDGNYTAPAIARAWLEARGDSAS